MPGPLDALKKATSLTNDSQGEWASAHPILSALAGLISPATDPHRDMGPLDVAGSALPLVGGMAGMRALKGIAAEERERRAIEQGYTKLGWHGTKSQQDFSEFGDVIKNPMKLTPFGYGYSGDFGIHVATDPMTATKAIPRGTTLEDIPQGSRIMPVRFRAEKSLEVPDMGLWRSPSSWVLRLDPNLAKDKWAYTTNDQNLVNTLYDQADKLPAHRGTVDFDWQQYLKDQLQRGGYDSIKYNNFKEGMGEPSYLLLDPRQVKSVNAAFDPSKFGKTKDIMKSIAPLAPIAGLKSAQTKQKE